MIGLASIGSQARAQARQGRPNIVWIWADNLAYADLGVYGAKEIRTPVIDKLADQGVRFKQYYIAHMVCSPSRAALLTGRQPYRVGIVGVLRPDGPSGIPADEITLAEALRACGYATAAIGKWHLGDRPQYLPTRHGFDSYFGIPYSMDMLPTIVYRDEKIVDNLVGDKVQNITERYTRAAIEFVSANRDRPFFLYFSHTIPHPPLNLPPQARTPNGSLYADAIAHMDQQTGLLLAKLDELGLGENTLVVFTSDNGPMLRDGDTGGLRGRIGTAYEGGVRVPFIARFPGRFPPGRVAEEPAIAYDLFPTLLRLAGADLPDDRVYDGQDITPLLTGAGAFERRAPFVWVANDRVTALREGRWKFHLRPKGKTQLYDLDEDPRESTPLNDRHPAIVDRLSRFAADYQSEVPKVWNLSYPVRDPAKRPSGVRRK